MTTRVFIQTVCTHHHSKALSVTKIHLSTLSLLLYLFTFMQKHVTARDRRAIVNLLCLCKHEELTLFPINLWTAQVSKFHQPSCPHFCGVAGWIILQSTVFDHHLQNYNSICQTEQTFLPMSHIWIVWVQAQSPVIHLCSSLYISGLQDVSSSGRECHQEYHPRDSSRMCRERPGCVWDIGCIHGTDIVLHLL